MEVRKVQSTGGASYIVTLPKQWVNAQEIKKNSRVGIVTRPDGTLLVTPKTEWEESGEKKTIGLDSIAGPEHLFRILVSCYIMGYTTIELVSKDRIDARTRDAINRFSQDSIGPEVIEEGEKRMVIKDLLNPSEMPFEKTIKRMYFLARSMHEDAVLAMSDQGLAEEVLKRDDELDRLYWLVSRQYNIVSHKAVWLTKMGLEQDDATFYFLISRIIERIGDHAVIIAKSAAAIEGDKLKRDIEAASGLALGMFKRCVDSWVKRDMAMANENIDSVGRLASLYTKALKDASKKRGAVRVAAARILESTRRAGEYSADISELVLNYGVKDE